jgi:WD40 repeat protein
LTADGKRIASTNSVSEPTNGPTFVRIYDPRTRELKGTLTVSDLEPRALAWSPDASLIALSLGGSVARPQKGQDDAELVLFDVAKGKLKTKLIGHSGDVYAVAFSPDGKLLASGGRDSHVRLWDVETGKLLCAVVADCDLVRGLAFSPDGKVLGSGGDDGAKLWNVETLLASASQVPHLRILPSIVGSLYSIIWSPDGKTIATGGSHSARIGKGTGLNPAGNIRLWDVAEGTERASLTSEPYYVKGLAYSPDGKLLASSTTKGTDEIVSVWDTATDTIAKKLKASHRVHAIAISPDGKTLAGAGVSTEEPYNSSLTLWNLTTGELLGTANETGHVVTSVAFSPDGKTIATSGKAYKEGALTGGAIWLWDSGDGGLKRKIESEDKIGVAVAYSPKDQLLVSGGYSGKERDGELMAWLWDATTGERKNSLKLYDAGIKRARFEEAIAVAFSPDGKLAATGNKDVLKVWDVATGTVVWQARTAIPENEWHCAMADALAFSPDGKTLAGAGSDGTVRLWSLRYIKPVEPTQGATPAVRATPTQPANR